MSARLPSGTNFAALIALSELQTQCELADYAFTHISRLAPHWRVERLAEGDFPTTPPVVLFAHVSTLLTAATTICWFLFGSGRGRRAAPRGKALRELLQLGDLPLLQSTRVRHGFQHIDERLDRVFTSGAPRAITPLLITESPPAAGTIVLKSVNPRTLDVSVLDETLNLPALMAEVASVQASIPAATQRLYTSDHPLYTPQPS